MLNKEDIKKFLYINHNYNNLTNEKTIETEFYILLSRYYMNKFKNSPSIISYQSIYNIDGLLQVKTIDENYNILIEAKSNCNFNSQMSRNAVLSQAIYYLKILNDHKELLPSVIILLEKHSAVIYDSKELLKFINEAEKTTYDWEGSASTQHILNTELINDLNNSVINFSLYDFNDPMIDLNNMFDNVHQICLGSIFKQVKVNNYTVDLDSFYVMKDKDCSILLNDFVGLYHFVFNRIENKIFYSNNDSDYKVVSENFFVKKIIEFLMMKNIIINEYTVFSFKKLLENFICDDDFTLKPPDLILEWFNEKVGISSEYICTFLDLHRSYNDWLVDLNRSRVSLRVFLNSFKNNPVFVNNNLEYVKGGFVRKSDIHSQYSLSGVEVVKLSGRPSFVRGIKFKN